MKKREENWCSGFEKKNGELIEIEGLDYSENESSVLLKYDIIVSGKRYTLWYSFSLEDKDAVSYEVADGIVVTLLPFAMRGGYNITSKIPVSERLWFQLTELFIPQFSTDQEMWLTQISCNRVNTQYNPTDTGTAMSCGVDSFYTFFHYTGERVPTQYKVSLLTFFQNGAHHSGVIGHSHEEEDIFKKQLAHVREFCSSIQFPLLTVTSNLDEFLSDAFWYDSFHYTHAYRNAGFVLLLQKRIRSYYYTGVRDIFHFSASLWDDTELYEKWLLPNLSTDCTSFYSVSTSLNRIEKTKFIALYPETYNHLLVCYADGDNCGRCIKCVRQLLILDYLGLLDTYKNSFPTEKYLSGKNWYEMQLLANKRSDQNLEEVYRLAREKGTKFSLRKRAIAYIHGMAWQIRDKRIKRELLRKS